MSSTFDPYHRWLGIPPKDRPPHHYRLLAIELFEVDAEVIRDAAEQRMAHVRTYQLGPHSAVSQKILSELATAKACLLDLTAKAGYDRELRARLGLEKETRFEEGRAVAAATDPLAFLEAQSSATAEVKEASGAWPLSGPRGGRTRSAPGARAWIVIGGSVGAVVVALVLALALVLPGSGKQPKPMAAVPASAEVRGSSSTRLVGKAAEAPAESPPGPTDVVGGALSVAPPEAPPAGAAPPDQNAVYSVVIYPGTATLRVDVGKASVEGSGPSRTVTVDQPRLDPSLLLVAECDGYERVEKWLSPLAGARESVVISLEQAARVGAAKRPARRKRRPFKASHMAADDEPAPSVPQGPLALLEGSDLRQWKVFGSSRPIEEVVLFEAGTVRFRESVGLWHMGMGAFPNCLVEFEYRYEQGASAGVFLKGDCCVQLGQGNTGLLIASQGKSFLPLVGQRTWNDEYEGKRSTTVGYLAVAEKPSEWNAMRVACQGTRWTVVLNNRIVNQAECSIGGKYPFWINGTPGFAFRDVKVTGLGDGEDPLPKLGVSAANSERRKVFVFNGTSAIVTRLLRAVPVTLEAWACVEPAPQSTDMFVFGSDDLEQATGLGLRISGEGNPGVKRTHADVAMTGFWCPARIPDKVWVHLGVTYDYAEARVFVNGAMAHKDKLFEHRGKAPFVVGYIGYGKYHHPQCFFSGKMRAVRITSGIRFREDFVPDPEFKKAPGETDFRTILIYDAAKTKQGVPVDLSGNRNDGHPLNVRIEDADVPMG